MSENRQLICDLMVQFYNLGWCSGTGGGITIKDRNTETIYLAPSAVQKERLTPDQIFELDGKNNSFEVKKPLPNDPKLKPSECMHLFGLAYQYRDAGAVLHSHAICTVLAGKLYKEAFCVTNLEMIKGLQPHKNTDILRIPIVENTEFECDLVENVRNGMLAYPNAPAVLVRNHGMYVWGSTWQEAKTRSECLHYLMDTVWRLAQASNIPIVAHGVTVPSMPPLFEVDHDLQLACCLPGSTPSTACRPRVWLLNSDNDAIQKEPKKPHHTPKTETFVPWSTVERLGIEHWRLDGTDTDLELERIKKERGYTYTDQVQVCREKMGEKYDGMVKKFFEEHYHHDDEVRYIMRGTGFFDVRGGCTNSNRSGDDESTSTTTNADVTDGSTTWDSDKWYRIQCGKGDMITLPRGVFHRFTVDESNYVHAMRLFQGDPVWTPIDITVKSDAREDYVKKYGGKRQRI